MAAWARGRSRRRDPADPLLALALPRAHRSGTRVERARPRSVSAAVRPGQALRILITPGGVPCKRTAAVFLPTSLPDPPSRLPARPPGRQVRSQPETRSPAVRVAAAEKETSGPSPPHLPASGRGGDGLPLGPSGGSRA